MLHKVDPLCQKDSYQDLPQLEKQSLQAEYIVNQEEIKGLYRSKLHHPVSFNSQKRLQKPRLFGHGLKSPFILSGPTIFVTGQRTPQSKGVQILPFLSCCRVFLGCHMLMMTVYVLHVEVRVEHPCELEHAY